MAENIKLGMQFDGHVVWLQCHECEELVPLNPHRDDYECEDGCGFMDDLTAAEIKQRDEWLKTAGKDKKK